MAAQRNWERVRDWITQSISEGDLSDGDRLPPEPQIAETLAVGRHSVRRATAALAAEGVLSVEQGRGTFVRGRQALRFVLRQDAGLIDTLAIAGFRARIEPLSTEVQPATPERAALLGLSAGDPVLRVLRRLLVDGEPLALTVHHCCAQRFAEYGVRINGGETAREIYSDLGVEGYRRLRPEVGARLPARWEAKLLMQHPDEPVMVLYRRDLSGAGEIVGLGEVLWRAGRVRLALDDAA